MPQKVFVYCSETASQDTIASFKRRGYETKPLGEDPDIFWSIVVQLEEGSVLVLLSHGDENGPLLVRGDEGDDMSDDDIKLLGEHLLLGKISLYLLSCHTGKNPFFDKLAATGASFAAPLGYASVESGVGVCNAYSKEGSSYKGWKGNGTLAGVSDLRNVRPIPIP